jgi:hypothetical protein
MVGSSEFRFAGRVCAEFNDTASEGDVEGGAVGSVVHGICARL